jgi:Xaa-Pro aminopeptidase
MATFKIPSSEIARRLSRFQKELQKNQIDGALIVQRVDLLYFSGTAQNSTLFIPPEGEALLLVKKYLPRARQESPLKNIVPLASIRDLPGCIRDFYGGLPKTMGFELDIMPVNEFQYYRKLFSLQAYQDISSLILKVRMIKSSWEIEQMQHTAEMTRRTFDYMRHIIRPGLTEMEFAAMFEAHARKLGHGGQLRVRNYQTEGYSWHVLSGASGGMTGVLDSPASGEGSSLAFPCGAGRKRLEAHEPVMVDFASVMNGYHLDETRMFSIKKMPDHVMKACEAAIQIHQEAGAAIRPGMTAHALYVRCVEAAAALGYQDSFLGIPGHQVSFVGHGIGLELVEPPLIAHGKKTVLSPGMTFALEPKLVFENQFIAGIESVFLVTKTGARLLTQVPPEIFVC